MNTSYIASGFLDLYEVTNNKEYLSIAESSCDFIINDLYKTRIKDMICFSYTPNDRHIVHNANLLGSALLARTFSLNGDNTFYEYSKKSLDFSLQYQKSDGSWNYSEKSESGIESHQIDFHQGFVIDSMCTILRSIRSDKDDYVDALKKALKYYYCYQFIKDGYFKWRYPLTYPIDIHNQAQGIITFYNGYKFFNDVSYLKLADRIAGWTISHLQDKTGYFYYQKWPIFTNKIPYIRWSNAWMLLALSLILNE